MGLLRLANNFLLRLQISEEDISIDPNSIQEFTVIQDMNKLLPEFRLRLVDAGGYLTHLLPLDEDSNKVYIELRLEDTNERINSFNFRIYRKTPVSESNVASVYDVKGLLDLDELFVSKIRAYSGSVKTTLESLGTEIGTDTSEISPSLNYTKTLIQPNWSTAEYLYYLRNSIDGNNNEGGYKCFVKVEDGRSILVFKTLNELISTQVAYKYFLGDNAPEDYNLANDYQIFDNFRILNLFGGKNQNYSYFDYYNNQYVTALSGIDDFNSLTEYFCVDNDEIDTQQCLCANGRNNDYTRTYTGKAKTAYHNRLVNLSKLWLFCLGNPNITPGTVILLNFSGSLGTGNLLSYQYSGYWLVERVVHSISNTLYTKLLLTRNGIDTDVDTSLYKAQTRKI